VNLSRVAVVVKLPQKIFESLWGVDGLGIGALVVRVLF
jgi:hypothetical protein